MDNSLAQECGYHRHRLENAIPLDAFTKKPYAQYVIRMKRLVII